MYPIAQAITPPAVAALSPGQTYEQTIAGISVLEGEPDEALASLSLTQPQAFNELVLRYQSRIYGLAYRMLGDSGDAHDLAQETFVRAYRRLETFDQTRRFSPWLYRIAVNLCLDHRDRHHPTLPLGDMDPVEKAPSPEACAIQMETRRRVQQAILELSPKYRAVIVLRHLEDLTYEEIATALDLPVNTVRTHLFRAREALRKILSSDELL